MEEFITLIIPLIGTTLGAAGVLFLKNKISKNTEKSLLGFASGVMIAASVWSLLIPAIEMSKERGNIAWLPATIGFLLGIAFLYLTDIIISHLKPNKKSRLSKNIMLIFAVTLHNIPEGMAVGVAYAGAVSGNTGITSAAATVLSLGIAIQNFPEGAIISMPLLAEGKTKKKAFLGGVLSGIVEPIAGFFTVLFVSRVALMLPYLLSFAAGAMFYVVIEELIPESQSCNSGGAGVISASLGFVLMMILDVALG